MRSLTWLGVFSSLVLLAACDDLDAASAALEPVGTVQLPCTDGCSDGDQVCGEGLSNSGECPAEGPVARCGDGVIDGGEECDGGEGCSDECTQGAICGDRVLDEGEECDEDGPLCSELCTIVLACGDGAVGPGEECDDGNQLDGDGCSSTCANEQFCGDGRLGDSEECDDGNFNPADECTNQCQIARCGDGQVHEGLEECDEGESNGRGDYTCSLSCEVPLCGDGSVDPGEVCDPGTPFSPECTVCGLGLSQASLVNLLTDGRTASLRQARVQGDVIGPLSSLGAALAMPILSGDRSVDLALSDGILIEDVETENGMGPGDYYMFVVYGTGSTASALAVRESSSRPPDNQVRLRVMNALAGRVLTVSLQETSPASETEFLLFESVFGEMSNEVTRAAGVLDVTLTVTTHTKVLRFEFSLGESVVGADSSIFISGTTARPVLIHTTHLGEVTIAHGARVRP